MAAAPSPYLLVAPATVGAFGVALSAVPAQTFLLMYLCKRFAPDGSLNASLTNFAAFSSKNEQVLYSSEYPSVFFSTNASIRAFNSNHGNDQAVSDSLGGLLDSPERFPNATWETCSSIPAVQSIAAKWLGTFAIISTIPAALVRPAIAAISDRSRIRRPLLLIPIATAATTLAAYAVTATFRTGLWLVVLAITLAALGGGIPLFNVAIATYISDTTPSPADRAVALVAIEATTAAASAIGTAAGASLYKSLPVPEHVFYIALVVTMIAFVMCWLFVPEPIQSDATASAQTCTSVSSPNNVSSESIETESNDGESSPLIRDTSTHPILRDLDASMQRSGHRPNDNQQVRWRISIAELTREVFENFRKVFLTERPRSFHVIITTFIILIVGLAGREHFYYYGSYRFGWDAQIEGQYILVGSLGIFLTAFLVPIIRRVCANHIRTHLDEIRFNINIAKSSIFICVVHSFALAFATSTVVVFVLRVLIGFSAIAATSLITLVSYSVDRDLQAQLFSFVHLFRSIIEIMSTLVYLYIWSVTVGTSIPNLFLVVASCVVLVAFGVSMSIDYRHVASVDTGEHGPHDQVDGGSRSDAEIPNQDPVVE